MDNKEKILDQIDSLIEQYIETDEEEKKFVPGKTRIQFAGPVYGKEEMTASLRSLLSGWFTMGKLNREFEKLFARFMKCKDCVTVNSGSSALMLAWNTLKHEGLENPIRDGDEVITSALTHTATVNSLILNDIKPVLVDADESTYNLDAGMIEDAISEKTRGILPMHFLGNPCEMDKIMKIAKEHDLYVIEDSCDAYGSEYNGKKVGTFGDMGTASFYTAHGITLGEGGAVFFDNDDYGVILKSLRAWGRACNCDVCKIALNPEYKCPLRFKDIDDKFKNYDLRYMFTNIGYNLKIIDMQAAFGIQQIKRFPEFIERRSHNFDYMTKALAEYNDYLILLKSLPKSKTVWFTLPITIREGAPFKRNELVDWLEKHNIETRPFFAGYFPEQPAYRDIDIKVVGDMKTTKYTRENSFFIGCYPGITDEMIDYVISVFEEFFRSKVSGD